MNKTGSTKMMVIVCVATVVVVGGAATWFFWPKDPQPTGKYTVDPITIAGDPWKLADQPTGSGDGAADIVAAFKSYDAAQKDIEQLRSRRGGPADTPDLYDQLDQLQRKGGNLTIGTAIPWQSSTFLIDSAGKKDFNLESQIDPAELEWAEPMDSTRRLEGIAWAAIIEGRMAEKRNRPADAEKIYKAVLVYGVRLTANKFRVYYQVEGLNAQFLAAEALRSLYASRSDTAQAKLAGDYMTAAKRAYTSSREVFNNVCRYQNKWKPGDLLMFARKHADPAWRVEALLALGMCKYNPVAKDCLDAVKRCLDENANDSDPWVAAAARWGRDLKIEDYRTQTK